MNYIAACSFLPDTDVEEKRKDISLARQQISFIVQTSFVPTLSYY